MYRVLEAILLVPHNLYILIMWDVTVVSTLADLCRYRSPWMWRGGRTRCCQEMPEIRGHPFSIHCPCIAMETLGSTNDSAAYRFFEDLGRRISELSGDSREGSFIFQRLSVTIQRSNAALFHESFTRHDDLDL